MLYINIFTPENGHQYMAYDRHKGLIIVPDKQGYLYDTLKVTSLRAVT